ncbi:MAG: PAS domain-containing protein [Candidatus Accumulibacter sp.]|nr:PAS domain-containing protein [Candidatus Accumulibacter propinquus]
MNIMATAHNSLDRQLLGDLDTASPWAAILDQLGLAIAVLNADLGFLRVTRQFAAATGATPDFFLGRQYFEVFPQPVVEAIFRQVRDSGIAHVHTARPFLPKLSPILGISYWNWSLTPFSDGEGAHTRRTQYLVLTMQDVSAPLNSEIRARRGEAELRTLLDHLPGMTYRAAADWSSDILLNCEALTGYTAAEINALPEKWLSLIHPDDVASVVVDCERLRTGPQQATLNYRIIDRNGNSRWIEDRKISLFAGDGSFLGVEGIAVDSAAATAREQGRGFSDPHYRSLIEAAFDGRAGGALGRPALALGYTRDELLPPRPAPKTPQRPRAAAAALRNPTGRTARPAVECLPGGCHWSFLRDLQPLRRAGGSPGAPWPKALRAKLERLPPENRPKPACAPAKAAFAACSSR